MSPKTDLRAQQRPYNMKFEVTPRTQRPQSHNSRQSKLQMQAADILREQHMRENKFSWQRAIKPVIKSPRAEDEGHKVIQTPQTLTLKSLNKIKGKKSSGTVTPHCQGHVKVSGMVSTNDQATTKTCLSVSGAYCDKSISMRRRLSTVTSHLSSNYDSNQRRFADRTTRSGNVIMVKQLLQQKPIQVEQIEENNAEDSARKQLEQQQYPTVSIQMRVKSAARPKTMKIQGDELKIQPLKIFDGPQTISCQSRVQTYMANQFQAEMAEKQRLKQETTRQDQEPSNTQRETAENCQQFSKTVLSRTRTACASRASLSAQETPRIRILSKNVTATNPSLQDQKIETPQMTVNTSTNVIPVRVKLNQKQDFREQQTTTKHCDLNDKSNQSQGKSFAATQNQDPDDLKHTSLMNPTTMKQKMTVSDKQQCSSQINLRKKHDAVMSNQITNKPQQILHKLQSMRELKTMSSGDGLSIAGNYFNQEAILTPAETSGQTDGSKAKLYIKTDHIPDQKVKRILKKEQKSQIRIERNTQSVKCCQRCIKQDIQANKKQLDMQTSSRQKIQYKPSVVEIFVKNQQNQVESPRGRELSNLGVPEEDSTYILSSSIPSFVPLTPQDQLNSTFMLQTNRDNQTGGVVDKLMGPEVFITIREAQSPNQGARDQKYFCQNSFQSLKASFLEAIKEEPQSMAHLTSEESTKMIALLSVCEKGGNAANKKSTRDLIRYLTQMQPELLHHQTEISASITDRKISNQSVGEDIRVVTPKFAIDMNKDLHKTLQIAANKATTQDSFTARAHQTQALNTSPRKQPVTGFIQVSKGIVKVSQPHDGITQFNRKSKLFRQSQRQDHRKRNSTYVSNESCPLSLLQSLSPSLGVDNNSQLVTDNCHQSKCEEGSGEASTTDGRQNLAQPELSDVLSDKLRKKAKVIEIPQPIEQIKIKNSGDMLSQEQTISDDRDGMFKFDDKPVDYKGQIQMVQEIFRQLSKHRNIADRCRPKNQRIIFKPNFTEYRRLELKPVSINSKKCPTRAESVNISLSIPIAMNLQRLKLGKNSQQFYGKFSKIICQKLEGNS